ncbi:hypothetical protein KUF71_010375 [Frankliniella fusca]|uniref:Uncharacterized protein n=1 Tax=Frankliniella fusca TaxID=407009 RepID=A0AAE1HGX8_9NEOP|nr:hypothetical protein KUF71_010375 [Frankliniella fusca]
MNGNGICRGQNGGQIMSGPGPRERPVS